MAYNPNTDAKVVMHNLQKILDDYLEFDAFKLDTDNSDDNKIILVRKEKEEIKQTEQKLPNTWEEFCFNYPISNGEAYINTNSKIFVYDYVDNSSTRIPDRDDNNLPSRKLAEAMLALCQLLQLREVYNDGWQPNWNDSTNKYCIDVYKNEICRNTYTIINSILAFKTVTLREKFFKNFTDLIEIAKPLL